MMFNLFPVGLRWRLRTLNRFVYAPFVFWVRTAFSVFMCPVCRKRIPYFKPLSGRIIEMHRLYGVKTTSGQSAETFNSRSYLCPRCNATDRSRLYALYLDRYLFRNSRVTKREPVFLDIAPCPALQKFIHVLLSKQTNGWRYISADLMREEADIKVNITHMPEIDDRSIDFLLCSHVLEHVTDDKSAMRELYRILKIGGSGIIMVPIILGIDEIDEDPSIEDVGERWRRFGQDNHVRAYSKAGFVQRLQEAGFRVEQLGRDIFGSWTFLRAGITLKSVLYVVHRDY